MSTTSDERLLLGGALVLGAWYFYTRQAGLTLTGQPTGYVSPPSLAIGQGTGTGGVVGPPNVLSSALSLVSGALQRVLKAPGNGPGSVAPTPIGSLLGSTNTPIPIAQIPNIDAFAWLDSSVSWLVGEFTPGFVPPSISSGDFSDIPEYTGDITFE